MRSRIRLIGTLLLLTVAALLGGTSNRDQTLAATYTCRAGQTCPNNSTCEGSHWSSSGNCSITCYKEAGAPGQIVYSGSANCATSPDGGGGGGGFEEFPVLP